MVDLTLHVVVLNLGGEELDPENIMRSNNNRRHNMYIDDGEGQTWECV